MTDKAVSTEDLCINVPQNTNVEAARLEAVIKTLIENKVESLKNAKRKSSSITSSPKTLFNKLRGTSTSTVSSKDREEFNTIQISKKCKLVPKHLDFQRTDHKPLRRSHRRHHSFERNLHFSDDQKDNYLYMHTGHKLSSSGRDRCFCKKDENSEIHVHMDDDFVSLNMEDYDKLNSDELDAMRAYKRAQRKKRRRRKHRQMKKQLAMSAVAVPVSNLKHMDDDELSERARMAIIITAALLLFMCLLLVGITLRMAPLIDDIVRKENEELMNSITQDTSNHNSLQNLTASVPFSLK